MKARCENVFKATESQCELCDHTEVPKWKKEIEDLFAPIDDSEAKA